MNPYQEALRAIKQAHSAKRLDDLKNKLKKANYGKCTIDILSEHPSRITNTWSLMQIVKPPALVKGAPSFTKPRQTKQTWYDCPNCFNLVRFVDVNGRCVHCRVDEVETSNLTEG